MLMFDLSVAKVAALAGFSGVRGFDNIDIYACIVGSKSSKMRVT